MLDDQAGRLPLPEPEQGGSIEALNSFLNLASRNDFVLVVAWWLALRFGDRQRSSSPSCSGPGATNCASTTEQLKVVFLTN
jgi:hypothetical protein